MQPGVLRVYAYRLVVGVQCILEAVKVYENSRPVGVRPVVIGVKADRLVAGVQCFVEAAVAAKGSDAICRVPAHG